MEGAAEVCAKNVFPQQPGFLSLSYCVLQTLNGKGILGAAVDVAFIRSDGVCAYNHAFEYRMWVAFKKRTVHECARVAFVGIAYDVFLRAR